MGAGASAGSADLKSKVFLSEAGDNFFIPLKNLASHLKVYQHCTTGEVLVLVDHNIGEISSIVDQPNDWFPVSVSKKESKYLETLKVLTSLNEREGQSSEGNGRLSSRTVESGLMSLKRHDSDRSLLDNLRVVGPESDRNRKMSDDPARKGKLLPPISIPPSLFGQTMPLTPHRMIGESNLGSKRLLVLGRSDDNSPASPRTQVADVTVAINGRRDSDSDFGGSPCQAKESPLALKSSRKPRSVKALRLSDDSAVTTEHKGSDAANQLDIEVQIDSDMIESAAADCCQDSSAVIARLVRENLVYNAESRTHCCLICGDVADDSYPIEQVEEQAMRCITKRELQARFTDINSSLVTSIEIMTESNRFQMALVFCKAMIIFEKRCTLNTLALSLTKKVASIPYYASDGKWLSALEEEILVLRATLLADLKEHSLTVNEGGSDREVYEEMKRLYRILGATVIQIHAKRRALRMFDQYVMDVADFTFVKKLCRGAFATVYLAKRKDSGQHCAIKVMSKAFIKESNMVGQVLRERSIMSSIVSSNPKISEMFVRMFSAFQSKQSLYIAMEFVQGGDCLTMLTARARFTEKVARHCVAEVALALKYLHEHGVVHRDVKPDNVMITVRGHIKLTDFGLAAPWIRDSSSQATKKTVGYHEKNGHTYSQTEASGFERQGSARSSDENSSVHSVSASTSFSASMSRRGSSTFEGGSLSRSVSPKKSPLYDDSPHTKYLDLDISAHRKGVPQRAGSFDISSRSSASQASVPVQHSISEHSRSIWLERSLGKTAMHDSADHTSESSLVFRRVGHSLLLKSAIGGNYLYASPEAVMQTGYDHTVDWWAVGILLFHFLAGVTPFMAESKERSMEYIVTGKIQWEALPEGTSESGKRFIGDLLTHLRTERLGYDSDDKVLQHEYFDGIDFSGLYVGPGPFTVEFNGAGDTRYFDAAPGSVSASRAGHRGADSEDGECNEDDIEKEIDTQETEDDEFLPFTANPR